MNYSNMSESEYCNTVIKRIKEYMEKNDLKQLYLSKKSNINQSTLSKILSGEVKINLHHIFRLCNALNVDPKILLSFNQEIITDTMKQNDSGVVNKKYLDEQILIRSTTHPAFKGYIGNEFYIYFYSTISTETSLLEGKLSFEDTEYHNYCKATLILYTGQKDSENKDITKNYYGELIVSLTMGTCYCILINSEIGEICSINFKHAFLFNQKLISRVCTVNSTSSGGNKLPIMQRALITEAKLNAIHPNDEDFQFVRGQLKLNETAIYIPEKAIEGLITSDDDSISKDLKDFFSSCIKMSDSLKYDVFDETKIRSINVSSDVKAQGISILRNKSIALKYNKISTKTEEFVFQYIDGKTKNHNLNN